MSRSDPRPVRKNIIIALLVCLAQGCAVKVFDEGSAQQDTDYLLYSVSEVRGLEALEQVPVSMKGQDEIRALLEEDFAAEYTDEDLANEAKLYYHLGLVTEGIDIKEELISFYEGEAAAFYSPRKDEMILISPVRNPKYAAFLLVPGSKKAVRELILSHELVHALEDQHFHLEDYSATTSDNQDHLLAVQAVAEGSAMLFSSLYLFEDQLEARPDLIEELIESIEEGTQKELARAKVPEVIIAPAFFSYNQGLKFVYEVYRERGIEGVNELYEDESLSTENILHPIRYLAGLDAPVEVELDELGESDKGELSELEVLCEDTFGEFGVDLILRHYLPADVAAKAAEGWGGDRYKLLEKNEGMLLFSWSTLWDTQIDADEFYQALLEVLHIKYPGLKRTIKDAGFEEFTREEDDATVIIYLDEKKVGLFEVPDYN